MYLYMYEEEIIIFSTRNNISPRLENIIRKYYVK